METDKPEAIKDCRRCKTYTDCNGKGGYCYADIRWCPYQCLWIIENADKLRDNDWGDYDDNIGARNISHEAAFEKGVNVVAEVEVRLQATGEHGKKLQEQVREGREFNQLSKQARAALMYVKGWRRKRISYLRWLREVYFKNRSHKKEGE